MKILLFPVLNFCGMFSALLLNRGVVLLQHMSAIMMHLGIVILMTLLIRVLIILWVELTQFNIFLLFKAVASNGNYKYLN